MNPDPYAPLPPSTYGAPPGPPQGPAHDDTLAWAGVATSVISWLTCCCAPIPFVGFVVSLIGLLLAVVGVVCGALAYRTAKAVGARTDLPIIAMVVGGLKLLLTAGIVVLAVVMLGAAGIAAYFDRAGH